VSYKRLYLYSFRERRTGLFKGWIFIALLFLREIFPCSSFAQPSDPDSWAHSVVRIIANSGNTIGSGSIIKVDKGQAYVLTAYHVISNEAIKGIPDVQVELLQNKVLKAQLNKRWVNIDNDVALLTVEQWSSDLPSAITWPSPGETARNREEVSLLGHHLAGPSWAWTTRTVSRIEGGIIFIDRAASQGYSGSPILNKRGAIVGMIITGSSGGIKEPQAEEVPLSRAISWAIIDSIIGSWFDQISLPRAPTPRVPISTPRVQTCQYQRGRGDYTGCTFEKFGLFHKEIDPEGFVFKNSSGIPEWIEKGLNAEGSYSQARLVQAVKNGFKNLKGAYLAGADLQDMNLEGVNFNGSYLNKANFIRARINGASFEDADMQEAIWVNGKRCKSGSVSICMWQ